MSTYTQSDLAGDLDSVGGAGELTPEELLSYVREQCAKAALEPERSQQREVIDAQCEESDALGLDSDEHNRRLVERQRASANVAACLFASPVAPTMLALPVTSRHSTRGRAPRRIVRRAPRRIVRRTRTAVRGDPDLPPQLGAALPVRGAR